MKPWFEIKVTAMLGPDEKDDKQVVILGRRDRWLEEKLNMKRILNTGRRC